ncbi:MAG: hypothetical protein PF440_03040 [Thiomicrorhabdus sp.]|nr:hypothetical protein [Thiomicrorhabdus sp.]
MRKYKGFKIPMLGLPYDGKRKTVEGKTISIRFRLGGTIVNRGDDAPYYFYGSWCKAIDCYRRD